MQNNAWISKIKMDTNLTIPHIQQYITLWGELKDVQLREDVEDSLFWNLATNGEYSTTSAYNCHTPGSALCSFSASRQNPHNNDPKAPTRHRVHVETYTWCGWSSNITRVHDRSTKNIYIQERLQRAKIQKDTIQRSKYNESEIASEYGQEYKWTKSPEDNQVASITLPRPSRKGNLANVVHLIPVQTATCANKRKKGASEY
jgi:hypothetical protein